MPFIILHFLVIGKKKKGSHVAPFVSVESYHNIAQDGGPDKVSVFVSFDVDISPIQQQLGTFIHPTLDQRLHPGLGFGRDQGPHICPRLITLRIHACKISLYKNGSIMLKHFKLKCIRTNAI